MSTTKNRKAPVKASVKRNDVELIVTVDNLRVRGVPVKKDSTITVTSNQAKVMVSHGFAKHKDD